MSGFARLARRRSAFTLVELLVVIGIIALLVAILLPALSAARKQAAAVKCAAHLRDIGNAFAMYSIDNKGYFPVVQHDSYRVGDREVVGTGSNAAFWWDFLAKYVTKTKMGAVTSNVQDTNDQRKSVFWGCPAWDGWVSGSIIVINRVMTGYGMNWDVKVTPSYPPFGTYTKVSERAMNVSFSKGTFFKQSQWISPSTKLLLADSRFYSTEQLAITNPNATEADIPGQSWNMALTYAGSLPGENQLDVYRHGKYPPRSKTNVNAYDKDGGKVAFNVLYCDGHVATELTKIAAYKALRQRFPG